MSFIVEGRNFQTMQRVYYTGRTGAGWISTEREEAFVYATEREADRKARTFNRTGGLHHCTFWSADAEADAGHAAGARAMSEEACGR